MNTMLTGLSILLIAAGLYIAPSLARNVMKVNNCSCLRNGNKYVQLAENECGKFTQYDNVTRQTLTHSCPQGLRFSVESCVCELSQEVLCQGCVPLEAEWNGLRAGFGINPFDPFSFAGLPRTVAEAINSGWKLDNTLGCGKTGTYFNGNRYIKDNDPGAMVLMDKNGYIAGIQAGIPKTTTSLNPNYPKANNMKYRVFNEEPNMWVTTAYFSEPSTICSTGRSESDFNNFGTGRMLSFQVGSSPSDLLHVPMDQKDVVSTTKFVEGNCFVAMGKHFWYDMTVDMSCDDTFPVFLLYNSNRLNGFGWAFNPNYSNSPRWEHPTRTVFGAFIKEVPTCLGKDGPVSILHVYLTDNPRTGNFC